MQASNLTNAGLYTFPNDLSQVPPGALLTADNVVINRNGTVETRRGLGAFGSNLSLSPNDYVTNFFPYQNRLIISDTTNKLSYDSTGSQDWVAYSGTYTPPTGMPKIHGLEANKNFYLTTSNGVYKLDAITSTPTLAGGIAALNGTATVTGASGFLGAEKQCVYQIVFGYTDSNGNLILGNPSQRILVSNTSATDSANASITFSLPAGLTTSYFYQLYRTPQTTYSGTPSLNVPPGAELQLATQQTITSGNISAGSITYTDVTIDSLLGATLYTCPSQEGPLQTNDPPPLCLDFCVFGGMVFYANVQTAQSVQFNLISVGSPNGIQNDDTVTINGVVFTGKASQDNASRQFKVDSSGTVASNIDATAQNLVACINANVLLTNVYAYYTSGYNDLPGRILLQAANLSQAVFYVTSSRGGAFSPVLPSAGTSFASSNDVLPNGIYVSKLNQPEAVPLTNLQLVGGGDQPIYRVFALRDRVVVLKSDGVFTITGSDPANLQITPLDNTVVLIAPEAATLLNNNVYCMTNQAVVAITESGVIVKSRAIEFDLLKVTAPQYTNFSTVSFAFNYESERQFLFPTVTDTTDAYPTQIWCYDWITDAWSHWPIDASAGIINPFDNTMYLARPSRPDYVYKERKTFTIQDYIDDITDVTIVSSVGTVVTLSSVDTSWVGSYLQQDTVGQSLITAVDSMNSTLTVEDTITWTAGAAQILEPIAIDVMWCPITGGYPHLMKNWTRCNFWFNGGTFTELTAGFISDIGSSAVTVDLSLRSDAAWGEFPWGEEPWGGETDFAQTIPTLVPRQQCMSHWLQPSVQSSTPYTQIQLLGCSITYDIVSDVFR